MEQMNKTEKSVILNKKSEKPYNNPSFVISPKPTVLEKNNLLPGGMYFLCIKRNRFSST